MLATWMTDHSWALPRLVSAGELADGAFVPARIVKPDTFDDTAEVMTGPTIDDSGDVITFTWVKRPKTPDERAADLAAAKIRALAALADTRWRHETGGCTIDGLSIRTDRETRAMLTSAITAGIEDTPWKLGNGQWVVLTASQMASIAAGIAAHVSACFARERALSAEIAAASTPAEVAGVDLSAGWPIAQ